MKSSIFIGQELLIGARLLNKCPGSRQIKWWFSLHGIILESFQKENQLFWTKKKLKGELIVWRTKVYARVQGYSFLVLFCSLSLLVEVALRVQNSFWNFKVPHGHKHFHNKLFFLLPSFHTPWNIVIFINYFDSKRNSIAIHFLVLSFDWNAKTSDKGNTTTHCK
jgi:hypothetical protein